ncbi:hypothetical protein ACR6C2_02435 [Streptomyces sp. INA 01156]
MTGRKNTEHPESTEELTKGDPMGTPMSTRTPSCTAAASRWSPPTMS